MCVRVCVCVCVCVRACVVCVCVCVLCVCVCVCATGEQLDASLYLVDGYKAFFSFCRVKKGYSGRVLF